VVVCERRAEDACSDAEPLDAPAAELEPPEDECGGGGMRDGVRVGGLALALRALRAVVAVGRR
jgi:hypothetical protein